MLAAAGKTASYREWKTEDPCKGDPAVLKKDLNSMNDLMSEFLTQTGMGIEGTWTDDQVNGLDSAQNELPPGVDALSKSVSLLKKCKMDPQITSAVKKADDNIRDTRQRLQDAPSIIPVLKAKIVLTKWKADQAEALKSGREQWCAPSYKPGTVPDIFYAAEDEMGKTEFHFCNDVKVVTETGGKPALVDPDNKTKKKEHAKYLEAATKYPATEVQKAPKVDMKAVAAANATSSAGSGSSTDKPAEAKPAEEKKPEEKKPEEAKPAEEPKKEEAKKEEPKKEEKKSDEKKKESGDLKPED
jgi:hypothetical protein